MTLRADRLDRTAALGHLNRRLAGMPGRRVLLFVHGYNTRFEEAVYRFAQIAHDSRAPALPVLFTWPSRGTLLGYAYDRESANYSRDALEAVLRTLATDPAVGEITVLAHSMGNWVALEAMRQMAIRDGRVAPKIKQIILAAPDVDFDVFRSQIAALGQAHPPITMFVSRNDETLALSRAIWGDVVRAGAVQPGLEPYRSKLAEVGITPIDLSSVSSSDPLNHSTFAASPQVVRLIGERLASGQALTDAKSGIGEKIGAVTLGAASTVGSAAGVVVSAPFAVIDPQTRDTLAERAGAVGDHFSDTVRSTGNITQIGR